MLGLGTSIAEVAARGRGAFGDHALALDFRTGRYRQGAAYASSPAALTGYSYNRPGQKWELEP